MKGHVWADVLAVDFQVMPSNQRMGESPMGNQLTYEY